jgi:hypothetical protein
MTKEKITAVLKELKFPGHLTFDMSGYVRIALNYLSIVCPIKEIKHIFSVEIGSTTTITIVTDDGNIEFKILK